MADRTKVDYEGTSHSVEVDGVELHYHKAGAGHPVLALHGGGPGGNAWSNWQNNIGPLAEHFEVYALDIPGFGLSGNPPRGDGPVYSFYATWVQKFMHAVGVAPAHLVGNSLGAGLSIQLALQAPDLVGRLVLNSAPAGFSLFTPKARPGVYMDYYENPTKEALATFLHLMVYDPDSITDEMIEQRHEISTRPEITADPPMLHWVAIARKELAPRLEEVTVPTLLVWGRDDRGLTFDAAIFMLQEMPNADLVVLSKTGHWAQYERPDTFNRMVIDFFNADSTQ